MMMTRQAKRRRLDDTRNTANETTGRNDTPLLRNTTTSRSDVMTSQPKRRLTHDEYTVALICPLYVEMCAAMYMLDEEHETLPGRYPDYNHYVLGQISGHNVAIAFLPEGHQGIGAAAVVATNMGHSFPAITLRMLVGIGGGVPTKQQDVHLGDVVVGVPTGIYGGVVEYDLGKETPLGFERKGSLCSSPSKWLAAFPLIRARHTTEGNKISTTISQMIQKYPQLLHYRRPAAETDILFKPDYNHKHGLDTCGSCDETKMVHRVQREDEQPHVFYGLIASGNSVMKNGAKRDKISKDCGDAICFEMEAAGLMSDFQCIVIRGLSDYSDSHKQDDWQPYAAAAAVAFAKEVLSYMPKPSATVPQSSKPVFMVPFDKDESFIGRADVMDQISLALEGSKKNVALAGIGGVGKTQIAIEFCYRYRGDHPESHILWVHASNPTRIERSYFEIARRLKIPICEDEAMDIFGAVSEWLSDDRHGPWLVVIDSADNEETFFGSSDDALSEHDPQQSSTEMARRLPFGSQGALLMTTRNKRVGLGFAGSRGTIKVPPLDYEHSAKLLRRKLTEDIEWIEAQAKELIELLAYMPLAISQAASYINEEEVNIQLYIELLRDCSAAKTPLERGYYDRRRDSGAGNAIFITWQVSFNEISSRRSRAAEILRIMAFLDGQSIPTTLLREKDEDRDTFTRAVGTLKAYSLVTQEKSTGTYAIHPLVQTCIQRWVEARASALCWQERALFAVFNECPPDANFERRSAWEIILPHIEAVLQYVFETTTCLAQRGFILTAVARYDRKQGRFEHSLGKAEEALVLFKKIFETEHPQTLHAIETLILALISRRNFIDAEVLSRQLVKSRQSSVGPQHRDTLEAIGLLIRTLYMHDNIDEAVTLSRQVLSSRETMLGERHPDTLSSMSDLAAILGSHGYSQEAEELLHNTLKLRLSILGKEHPDSIATMKMLGVVLTGQKSRHQEAEKILREAVFMSEKVSGKEHPASLEAKNSLGIVLYCRGKFQEAIDIHQQNIKSREKSFGKDHPATLASTRNLNQVLRRIEKNTLREK